MLALLGYVWGLGPLNRLNTARGITPPAKLAGLDRITDQEIRGQLQLDQTREALSRINDGKQATVEAYGTIDGNRMFVVIALRGKVDINKTVADSGATPDKVKKIGNSTCVESTGNLPTQCYRGSNTLTVIAQSANEGVAVDQVAPVAEEAFKNAMNEGRDEVSQRQQPGDGDHDRDRQQRAEQDHAPRERAAAAVVNGVHIDVLRGRQRGQQSRRQQGRAVEVE